MSTFSGEDQTMRFITIFLLLSFLASCSTSRVEIVTTSGERVRIASTSELEKIHSAWVAKGVSSYRVGYKVRWLVGREASIVVSDGKYRSGESRSFGEKRYLKMSEGEGRDFMIEELFEFARSHFDDSRYTFYTNQERNLLLGYEYEGQADYEDDWSSKFIVSFHAL